jgi:glycosyltransferase involved in cell wall biosynthesis
LRIAFLGLRGFPEVQGGVEAHAEHLCPLLAELGCEVEAIVRSPYMPAEKGASWRGVRFVRVWSPKSKGLEAIVHTFLGVLVAAWRRPHVLHIHAIGPALMTPLARLLGLCVVVTHHGPDYDRQKWGRVAKWALRSGEFLGMRMSNGRIVISEVIRGLVREKYGVDASLVPNGVTLPERPETTGALERFGLAPHRYVLLVSRLVQEKRHFDLLEAFARAGLEDWKLAFVGAADHPDEYQRRLIAAADSAGAVMTGFQSGLPLRELYAHAGLFVLPSSHEGLPIALLEALSYGLPVAASDIPANLEIGLEASHYFPLGNVEEMAQRMRDFAARRVTEEDRAARRDWVSARYDWRRIVEQTLEVYRAVAGLNR